MLIKNAGYMWHRRYIRWDRRELVGTCETDESTRVNFADQSGIHGLYDAAGSLIYVGQAGRGNSRGMFDRLKDHALEDELFCMWERFTWFGLFDETRFGRSGESFDDPLVTNESLLETLNALESMCIYLAMPKFNRKWCEGFNSVRWFYQPEEYTSRLKARSD